MAVPKRAVAPAPDTPWTVSTLAGAIDTALRQGVAGPVRVVGEVSGLRDRTHWYFDLKDENAVVNCVMFASASKRFGLPPRDGELVIIKGRIEFYAKGGKVSFIVDSMERSGEGPLDRAYRELCATLKAEGYFDPERKKALPRFPRKIAVLTSRSAAALQDVINTCARRCPAVGIVHIDVPVQGDAASGVIAHAIDLLSKNHERLGVDAAILTRGGGSKEDLWCFNDRVVADAIFRCDLPLIAAIGHETDTTIAELVADERCATPTQAAMRLLPDRVELARQVDSTGRRLANALARGAQIAERNCSVAGQRLIGAVIEQARLGHRRLAELELRLERVRPQAVYARMIASLDQASERLRQAMNRRLEVDLDGLAAKLENAALGQLRQRETQTDAVEKHLQAVAPRSVLERGFSITLRADGRLVKSVKDVATGDIMRTHISDGSVESVVSGRPSVPRKEKSDGRTGGPNLFSLDGA